MNTTKEKTMTMNDILALIADLSRSQGFYGRVYRSIMELNKDDFKELSDHLESQGFKDGLDVIYYFEC